MNWRAPRGRGQNPQTNNVNYGAHPQYQPPSVAGWPGYQVNYNTLQYGNYPAYPTVDQYGQVCTANLIYKSSVKTKLERAYRYNIILKNKFKCWI